MSAREWKPGDVAMIRVPLKTQPGSGRHEQGNGDLPAVHTSSGGWAALDDVDYYWESDYAFHDAEPRPLVVIDAEDREQVERLTQAMRANGWSGIDDDATDDMQRVLREFVDPKPRIEEPTGLGAVVEAVHGNYFVRVGEAGWVHMEDASGTPNSWQDIAVVRVVREGWSE